MPSENDTCTIDFLKAYREKVMMIACDDYSVRGKNSEPEPRSPEVGVSIREGFLEEGILT